MEIPDYSEIITQCCSYQEYNSNNLTGKQNHLLQELINKLIDLQNISEKIVILTDKLSTEMPIISFDQDTDTISFGEIKLKLNRADPNIPIQVDNVSTAFSKSQNNSLRDEEVKKSEKELELLTLNFYSIGARVTKIIEKAEFPLVKKLPYIGVRWVRDKLIEHPESNDSLITYDSFSYSKNEGPSIKGLRKDDKIEGINHNFLLDSKELLKVLTNRFPTKSK